MKAKLALGVALLAACSEGSAQSPVQRQVNTESTPPAEEAGDVAGGETSEFSGNISSCPEILSSEPLDLADPEVASWVAMAQGHHEQTLLWRRLVQSGEVTGFTEHTSISIDVNVPRGREVVYGGAGNTDNELAGCEGLRARQLQLDITLATADGAVSASFSGWFQPGPTESGGTMLRRGGLNPDGFDPAVVDGTLDLGLDPALGGTQQIGFDIEFHADSVRGRVSPDVSSREPRKVWPEAPAWAAPWWPIDAVFPDDPCGSEGTESHSIGLDQAYDIDGTPRIYYQRMVTTRAHELLPAVWKGKPSNVEPSPLDVPLEVPPPTQVSLEPGEPTRACVSSTSLIVYAPLTVTTADGRVNFTQPFAFNMGGGSAYAGERTLWVPAADFNEHAGLEGMNLESGYGSIYFQNDVDWQRPSIQGSLEVVQWDAFTERSMVYPVLEWCKGWLCSP